MSRSAAKDPNREQSGFLAFAKSSGIFFIGSTMSKVITLLLIPLYTNVLPTSDYGYYDLSITCVTLLTSFLYFDIWSSVMRFMRDDLEGEAPHVVISAGWVIFAVSTLVYYLVGGIASLFVEIPCLPLILLYGTMFNVHTMVTCIARGWGNNVDFALSGVLCTLVNVLLNLALILVAGMGYEALYISYIAGFLVQCLYLVAKLRMWRQFGRVDWGKTKELLAYSTPLGINSVAYWFLNCLSRVVVSLVLSVSANGIFAIGSKFGSTIALATTCFTLAWQDIAFTKELRPTSFYSNAISQYAGFLCCAVAVMLPAIALAFPLLVGAEYADAYGLVPSFLWVAIVSAVSTFIGNVFYVIKDTKTIGVSMVVSCLCNIVLMFPLTCSMGCLGANVSVLIAFALNIAIRVVILRKKIGLKIGWRAIAAPAIILAVSSIVFATGSFALNALSLIVMIGLSLFMYRGRIGSLFAALKSKMGKDKS